MLSNLTSLLGMVCILALAWSFSNNRKKFPWRVVAWGLAIQFVLAFVILDTRMGLIFFEGIQQMVLKLNEFANEGAKLAFGPLADSALLGQSFGPNNAFVFAVSISATIIVIAALSSLLYHLGILQKIVHAMALAMRRLMRTSGSESLATAANCFIGQTEAPLIIKPYIIGMTRSELLALMVGGMATIAGGMLAVYSQMGASAGFPDMAGHLMTASLMSAPGALMIAKILIPETETSETSSDATVATDRTSTNSIDALCRGANEGLTLSLNILAMLVAFVAVVAMINFLLQLPQTKLGVAEPVTLQQIIGWLNAPFAWLMGVPWKDCGLVGQVLGERFVLNELFGFITLTQNRDLLDERSFVLASYALCGFANFGSIAIQIGGISALVPKRRADLARLGLLAMFGGLLTCYLTAALVGTLT